MKNKGNKSLNNINMLQKIISKTILSSQKYKTNEIYGSNELNICINKLEEIYQELNMIKECDIKDFDIKDSHVNTRINKIKNDLILVIKNFGTESFNDIMNLLFTESYINDNFINTSLSDKFDIIQQYVHPINFKVINWENNMQNTNKKIIKKNRIIQETKIVEN